MLRFFVLLFCVLLCLVCQHNGGACEGAEHHANIFSFLLCLNAPTLFFGIPTVIVRHFLQQLKAAQASTERGCQESRLRTLLSTVAAPYHTASTAAIKTNISAIHLTGVRK